MNKHILLSVISAGLLSLTACEDWLSEKAPASTSLEDFFTQGTTAVQAVTGAYVPLMWEFNQTYYPEWFIGDVVSDDALKGGQNVSDMSVIYDLENFKTQSNNEYLLDFYRAQYQGITRCNLALEAIPDMDNDALLTETLRARLLAEARFLRATFYLRLVRVFGGVPKVDAIVPNDGWKQPRASETEIYQFIADDLQAAIPHLWLKDAYAPADMGRATKGAAQAMLMKTYLCMQQYDSLKVLGQRIIDSKKYTLCPNYDDNFTLAGENGSESVFEVQYMNDPTSDYGQGNGFTRGTFTTVMTRTRNPIAGGWGFNKPTQNLYDAYEPGDPRRQATIINPTDEQIANPAEEIYLGSRYLSKKYALMNPDGSYPTLSHPTRGELNRKVIRYADVLLMYAEACCELGDTEAAKGALEQVRFRARHGNSDILPPFPYGNYADTQADLRAAIRHERRVELAMEGHRWYDLVRWGVAAEVMNAYREQESDAAKAHMNPFVKGTHERFPIPAAEINLNPMEQNFGY
ncbi:MAG: RagB/SusD family nutrient uptake outer membrane protein [Marinilabiliaceae bacterium]|nr:RagB/SusD family nutrient uptake outer membrane protein [Marinilabiliaceae bacterium]